MHMNKSLNDEFSIIDCNQSHHNNCYTKNKNIELRIPLKLEEYDLCVQLFDYSKPNLWHLTLFYIMSYLYHIHKYRSTEVQKYRSS